MSRRTVITGAAYVAVWAVCALLISLALFLNSSRSVSVASHDAVVAPDFSGQVVVQTGPVLPDPRSSGLGTWRDETGLSFEEVGTKLADAACASDEDGERVGTILVHDANLGDEALERGCVDLVLAGHLHNQSGPTAFAGENGEAGYSYTNGTTGGAAYAFALGSTIKRTAQVTLITYGEDGTPVGLQSVVLQPGGEFEVGAFVALVY